MIKHKTESELTQEFMTQFKAEFDKLPYRATVIKHCDRFTIGIPDLSISNERHGTVWIEAKRITQKSEKIFKPWTWIDDSEQVQLMTLAMLNGFYLVFDEVEHLVGFVAARSVLMPFRAKTVMCLSGPNNFLTDKKTAFQRIAAYIKKELYAHAESNVQGV
jgi:hypothetical protein